jgi:8-oxo-dGTP pyrophosphatase MutT (NUDIX family)
MTEWLRHSGRDSAADNAAVTERTFIREAAKLVVLDPDDRVLLFRYPHSNASGAPFWMVPGGRVHPGEPHEDAAARELREEAGIDADIGPLNLAVRPPRV